MNEREYQDLEAIKTTVIRRISAVYEKHFGEISYDVVATLSNASLGRNDITEETVRDLLRGAEKAE